MMQMQLIPRTSTRMALSTIRLPLTAIERAAGHSGDETWPPSLAFETFEANLKQIIGSLVRDDVLVEEGQVIGAKVTELRDAARLEAEAALQREQANDSFAERQRADVAKVEAAEERADDRKSAAARSKAEATQQAARERREEEQRLAAAEAKRNEQIERQERVTRQATLDDRSKAVASEKQANRTKAKVVETDEELRAAKKRRRANGS